MTSDHPHRDTPDKALALWMLDRMRDSEEFLGVIQAARKAGRPDVLDEPDYVARHKGRLAKLYQSDEDDEDTIDAPPSDQSGFICIASNEAGVIASAILTQLLLQAGCQASGVPLGPNIFTWRLLQSHRGKTASLFQLFRRSPSPESETWVRRSARATRKTRSSSAFGDSKEIQRGCSLVLNLTSGTR